MDMPPILDINGSKDQFERRRRTGKILVDTEEDYRAFLFAIHPDHGLLVVKSRVKPSKGSYWQVPGGHLDDSDYEWAADSIHRKAEQLQFAGQIGVTRELYEETGIDIRQDLSRLELAELGGKKNDAGLKSLQNLYKERLFYFLRLKDADFPSSGVKPRGVEGSDLHIKLSDEHLVWEFITEANLAVDLLSDYSGGKVSQALELCLNANAADGSTQMLLHSGFGGVANAEVTDIAGSAELPNEFGSDGNDIPVDEKDSSQWDSTQKASSEGCTIVGACQADYCSQTDVPDACRPTGYVEQVLCQADQNTPSSAVMSYRSCSGPGIAPLKQEALKQNSSLVVPVAIVLLVCIASAFYVYKRRSSRIKWIQRKTRYFDDDAFAANAEGLELVNENPLDLPPVD